MIVNHCRSAMPSTTVGITSGEDNNASHSPAPGTRSRAMATAASVPNVPATSAVPAPDDAQD